MEQKSLLFVFAENGRDKRESGWFSVSRGNDGSIISFVVDENRSRLPIPNEPFWFCDVSPDPVKERNGNKVFAAVLKKPLPIDLIALNFCVIETGQHQSFVHEECDENGNNRIHKVHTDHNRRMEISGQLTWVCVIDFLAHQSSDGRSQAFVVIPIAPCSEFRNKEHHQISLNLA